MLELIYEQVLIKKFLAQVADVTGIYFTLVDTEGLFIYKIAVKIKKLYFFTTVFWVIISCK